MPDTILLTGGTGFLGSNLLRALLKQDSRVVLLKRSFSKLSRIEDLLGHPGLRSYDIDQVPLARAFEENPIDLVIHCATGYGRGPVPATEVVESNLTLPLHLLQLAHQHEIRGFINTDTILDKRINHYALSKKQFLDWLQFFSGKLLCVNVALEHFYGPCDDASKFVAFVVDALLSEAPSIDLTPGAQKRDFIYVDDVVSAFLRVIELTRVAPRGFHEVQVGTGESIEIRRFVELVKELTSNQSTTLKFGALPYRENEPMDCQVDLTALKRLGWRAEITLREGLIRTIEQERLRLADEVSDHRRMRVSGIQSGERGPEARR